MRYNLKNQKRRIEMGLSLIELGMVLVFISLAMVPVVKMIGGPQSAEGDGNVSQVTSLKSKEAILANTMLERVMSSDFSAFDCDGSGNPRVFNPNTDLPTGGNSRTYNVCVNNSYNKPLYYQWSVVHLDSSNNGADLPEENYYYQATINVIDAPSGGKSLITFPAYFFYNSGAPNQTTNKTGILMALDSSGSMQEAESLPPGLNSNEKKSRFRVAIPYMFYRYSPAKMTAGGLSSSPPFVLDMWDDSQLDIFYGKQIGNGAANDPDTDTPNNEAFPYPGTSYPGLLGMGDCTSGGQWLNDPNLRNIFSDDARGGNRRNILRRLCSPKSSISDWEDVINENLSRIEAARSAALGMLLSMESNSNIAPNIQMGYIDWDDDPVLEVQMEAPQVIAAAGNGLKFKKMRERLLWLNRGDPSEDTGPESVLPITADGATRIDLALRLAVQELRSKQYNKRIIVLMTDGHPCCSGGTNTAAQLVAYARSVGDNEPDPDKQITIFTVGLIEADNTLMNNIANATPDGQAFIADSITELSPIFEQIAYQTQKIALLNISARYGLDF